MKKNYFALLIGNFLFLSLFGQSWTNINPSGAFLSDIWSSNDVIFYKDLANSPLKLKYSTDFGSTWNLADSVGYGNVTGHTIKNIFRTSNNTNILVLQYTDHKLYRSTNNGSSWTKLNGVLGNGELIKTILEDINGDIYLSTDNALHKSTDDGQTFTTVATGVFVQGAGFNPSIMLVDSFGNFYAKCDVGAAIYKSTDKGLNWTQIVTNVVQVYDMTISPTNNYIYVGGSGGDYVGLSTDLGATWTGVNPGYSLNGATKIKSNINGDVLVGDGATSWDLIYFTDDNANTWSLDTSGLNNLSNQGISTSKFVTTSNGCFYTINKYNLFKRCGSGSSVGVLNLTSSNNLSIFPNPSNGIFTILANEEIEEISVYNSIGGIIFSSTPNEIQTQLNLSNFVNGIYIIKLSSSNKVYYHKIIKK